MLRIEHDGKKLNLEFKDGRYQATFIPTSPDDVVEIIHEDVVEPFEHTKDYYLSQMQLEHGDKSSAFDHNMSTKSMLGYLLEDLDYIELALKDPNSQAHGRFQLNHEAVLTEFINKDGTLKTNSQTIAGKILNRTSSNTSEMIQKMTPDIIQTTIQTADFMTVSKQTKDSLFNAIFDGAGNIVNAINQSPSGTTIKSDLIHLDGKVSMDNAFARNLLVDNLNTNDITAFMGKFNHIVAQNIDVNSLTGDHARFLRVLLDGKKSKVRLTGDQLAVVRNDGSYSSLFTDNGLEIWRGNVKIGSVISLDAIDTYGFYNNRKSISLTTEPESYISLSYYSEQTNRYYRALGLGGDGRLRFHSPLYAGISNSGFRLAEFNIGSTKVSGWRDIESDGGIAVSRSREVWFSLTNGKWTTIEQIYKDLEALKTSVESLNKNTNNNVYTPSPSPGGSTSTGGGGSSGPSRPSGGSISAGDRVKIRSGVTTYYDSNNYATTIPTNKNGRNYRTETYSVSHVNTGRTSYGSGVNSNIRLNLDGVIIAWIPERDVYKV